MSLIDVLVREGLTQRGREAWGPCPVCGATQRGRSDRRGPVHVSAELWKCHAGGCVAGGDSTALVAAVRFGEVPPKGDPRWKEIFAELAGDHPQRLHRPVTFRKALPAREGQRNERRGTDSEPSYPPDAEVLAFWNDCDELLHLPDGDPALAYLTTRALDPSVLARLDLVRAVRVEAARPRWFPRPTWSDPERNAAAVYRLAIPVYDSAGTLRSLRFRAVCDPGARRDGSPHPKTYPAWGFGLAGLVMADPMAQNLLRGVLDGWDGRVLIAEGETDWWTLATHPDRFVRAEQDGKTYATFGIVAGSWTPAIASRFPTGARVVVWTDLDDAGDRYAETIRASLAPRCRLWRRPSPGTP